MLKRVIVVLLGLLIVFALVVWGAGRGRFGSHEEPGRVTTALWALTMTSRSTLDW